MKTLNFGDKYLRSDLPEVSPGDTIRITQRIREGGKERLIRFEGLIIAKKHGRGISSTITVRKIVDGVGVERIFPIHSPLTHSIEILSHSKVRRAKLYYIREKAAREVRKKMKRLQEGPDISTAAGLQNADDSETKTKPQEPKEIANTPANTPQT